MHPWSKRKRHGEYTWTPVLCEVRSGNLREPRLTMKMLSASSWRQLNRLRIMKPDKEKAFFNKNKKNSHTQVTGDPGASIGTTHLPSRQALRLARAFVSCQGGNSSDWRTCRRVLCVPAQSAASIGHYDPSTRCTALSLPQHRQRPPIPSA